MKQSGVCPKCGSDRIARVPSRALTNEYDAYVLCGSTALSAAPVTRYVCTGCGYIEQYLEDEAGLEKLRKKLG